MQQYLLILSDLHLGDGGPREDFRLLAPEAPPLDATLATFLAEHAEAARTAGARPHLVLAGDIVDLWARRASRTQPHTWLQRVLEAHRPAIAALRAWIAAGGALTWLTGNHDHALRTPRAWAIVREILPGLNPATDGAPAAELHLPQPRILITHGHQWDPWNRTRTTDPNDLCLGRVIDELILERLERADPTADKGDPVDALAAAAGVLAHGGPHGLDETRILGAIARYEDPRLRVAALLAEAIAQRNPAPIRGLRACSRQRFAIARTRSLARRRGPAEPPLLVVHGHTHNTGDFPAPRMRILDTGTWMPRVEHDGALTPARLSQRLTAAVVRVEGTAFDARIVDATPASS